MLIRHLCGAILTLFLATGANAAPQGRTQQSAPVEFHLTTFGETSLAAKNEKPLLKSDALNEVPTAAAADMKDPLKYSVWVLIGLGPIMWIWLAFFPRIRRK